MTVRGKHAGVGVILYGGGSSGSFFKVGYMGDDPTHGTPLAISRTGWLIISQKQICSGFGTEVGSTRSWRRLLRRKFGR